jgi:hypothetical protein
MGVMCGIIGGAARKLGINYPLAPFRRLRTHDVQDARRSCSDQKISRRATRMARFAVGRCRLATRACVLTVMPRSPWMAAQAPSENSRPKPSLGAITPQDAARIAIRRGTRLGTSTLQTSTRILACGSSDIRSNIWTQAIMIWRMTHSWLE